MRIFFTTSVRTMLALVALVAIGLGIADLVRMQLRSRRYWRKAESLARYERRSREIDAMAPDTRAREADYWMDNPFLLDPEWNRRMIPWLEKMKKKYSHAAANPRLPVPPDDPLP